MKALLLSAVTPVFLPLSLSVISYSRSDFPLSFLLSCVSGCTCDAGLVHASCFSPWQA